MLRLFLLIGTCLYLLYYFVAADDPLWHAIFGTACIGVTSIYGFIRAILHRAKWALPKDDVAIYEQMKDIEPGAFRKFMKAGEIKTFDAPIMMTQQGAVPDHVYYTLEGHVDVTKDNVSFVSDQFSFIGEISFIGGFAATATVRARKGTKAIVWDRKRLLKLMAGDDRFRVAVEALFAKNMAIKLANAAQLG